MVFVHQISSISSHGFSHDFPSADPNHWDGPLAMASTTVELFIHGGTLSETRRCCISLAPEKVS